MNSLFSWGPRALILFAGAIQTLAYAPFHLWPMGLISAAIAFSLIQNTDKKETLFRGWLFGLGIFGSGASWVYISIHEHGYAPVPLAVLLTFLFVAFLGIFQLLQFYLTFKLTPTKRPPIYSVLVFTSSWVLLDWFRSWFLTGFPWLYLGHSHLDSPLSVIAPITGVHGITWVTVFSAASIAAMILSKDKINRLILICPVIAVWVTALVTPQIDWTEIDKDSPLKVAVVQGNIPQELKWAPEHRYETILTYQALSNNYWGYDIILWPETAIPILMDQATGITSPLAEFAKENNTALITGIPYRAPELTDGFPVYHNSIASFGNGEGLYHKQKLVPFGEYVPLESLLRGLIQFFDLPMSSFSKGSENQPPLKAGDRNVSPFICYEIVYPDFVANMTRNSELLLTISNDAWFGDSIAPFQHLEIAQMRALETGRYLLRGTNNGISALVDQYGKIIEKTPQFVEFTLSGTVYPAKGSTPFMRWLSWPVIGLCLLVLVLGWWLRRHPPTEN